MSRLSMFKILIPLLLCVVVTAEVTTDQIKQDVADSAVTAKIESIYLVNKHLNPFNINTTTRKGVVTLTGSVNDETQRNLAHDLIKGLEGVQSVQNNIIVVPTAYGEKAMRPLKQKFMDRGTTAAVRSRLLYNQQLKGFKVNVETVNGIVTLHGVVPTDEIRTTAGNITADTNNVVQVVNNIMVRARTSTPGAERVGRQVSDEWLEARIETAILFNSHLSIRALAVEVDDGVCILSGNVTTQEQRELAGNIAERLQGIHTVENTIQVIEPGSTPPAPTPPAPTPPADADAPLKELDPVDEPVETGSPAVSTSTLEAPKE